jgi:hypothetical protein
MRAESSGLRDFLRVLGRWRAHLSETRAFAALTHALLATPLAGAAQRVRIASLLRVEARTLAMLPDCDLEALHTGLTPDQSAVMTVRPDGDRANQYLRARATRVRGLLDGLSHAALAGATTEPFVRALDETLGELASAIDLLELLNEPRTEAPPIACTDAIDRAAAASGRRVHVVGEARPHVAQVRGLLRLLSALLQQSDAREVRLGQAGTRAVLELDAGESRDDPERWHFLRFCAHLIRGVCERDARAIRLTIPLVAS